MNSAKSFINRFRDPATKEYRFGLVVKFVFYSVLLIACPLSLFFTVPQLARVVVTAVQEGDGATLVTGAVTVMVMVAVYLVVSTRSKNASSKDFS